MLLCVKEFHLFLSILSYIFAPRNLYLYMRFFAVFLLVICCSLSLYGQSAGDVMPADSCLKLTKIRIWGKHITKDRIILRELSVKEGDCIRWSSDSVNRFTLKLAEVNRQRLLSLKLFNDVQIAFNPQADQTCEMSIYLIDRFPIFPDVNFEFADRNFNVWWTEQHRDLNRINLGVSLKHNNFRGNHEIIGVTAQLGYTQKIGLSYELPFIDKDQKHGLGFSFFGLQNKEIAFKTESNKLQFARSEDYFVQRRVDAAAYYSYRPHFSATHLFQLAYHHYWISDTVARLNPDYLGNGHEQENVLQLTYKFTYNRVDNWEYPLRGYRFIAQLDNYLAFANDKWQSGVNLNFQQYFNPFPKWYANYIIRSRISTPSSQPYIFRHNLGYEYDYVRGYEYYVIDGSAFGLIRLDFKRELLNKRLLLPIRYFEVIPVRIYAKAFADAGIGHNKYAAIDGDQLNDKILYSYGFGIDFITLYDIKVRFEYTINDLNEKGLYLHRSGE